MAVGRRIRAVDIFAKTVRGEKGEGIFFELVRIAGMCLGIGLWRVQKL